MVSFLRSSLIALASVALVLLIAQPAFGSRAHNGFFNSLTDEQKDQVSEILHSGKPKAEIKENLRQWVSTQPKEVQVIF
jgi:hypothetical protein